VLLLCELVPQVELKQASNDIIFASLMLLRGAKPKVISEALGHASVAFTMDIYSHTISGMQEEAMALLDEIMPAGVSASNERQGAQMLT
jgi:hypothetical protein